MPESGGLAACFFPGFLERPRTCPGAGAEGLCKYMPGPDATFSDEVETYWAERILFRSRFEELSPRLLQL